MIQHRSAGILLHITSLPSPIGPGDLGPSAHHFLDWLAEAGFRWWQILPLNPTGYGGSPYQPWSAFAGNPDLVSLEILVADGLLDTNDLAVIRRNDRTDDERAEERERLLRMAHARFVQDAEYNRFVDEGGARLADIVLFAGIRSGQLGSRASGSWTDWEPPLRDREVEALEDARATLSAEIDFQLFLQFQFFRQHAALRQAASDRGIGIIGDIPIFIAHDSVDVWVDREGYDLDDVGNPCNVAGVPPDYFSKYGQRWGNPLYRWEKMASRGYRWWIDRLRSSLHLYDVVRIDHFRGFDEYWQIPASEPTAVAGEWVSGPGRDFFDRVAESITSPAILVEDLGEISDAVEALRDDLGYPGMKVVQFGFSDPESPHLPHNFASDNCVVYSGTHDNDTTLGWWKGLDRKERDEVRRVLGRPRLGKARATDAVDAIVHYVFASLARLAVVPMQDLLCLDSAARLNLPGKMRTSNWQWQMAAADLSSELAATTRARLIGLNRLGEAGEESERL